MAEITVEETHLREIVGELVQKHLKSSIEDVEEVRRSPAGTILRLEERVEFIQRNMATKADVANLKTRVDEIEKNMATKADIANLRTEFNDRIGKVEATLSKRIAKIETGQKLIYAFLLTMLVMLVKLDFFP